MITAQVTKVVSGGNTFQGALPVVYDTLIDGKIVVVIPGNSGSGEKQWFNISIQGV